MKKLTALLLTGLFSVSMVTSTFAAVPAGQMAQTATRAVTQSTTRATSSSGEFDYRVENGGAVITKYLKTRSAVVIPSALDGYTVTGLELDRVGLYATTFSIPATVTSIEFLNDDQGTITQFLVDANNPAYASREGALYNKTFTKLIRYGNVKKVTFTVPSTVKTIGTRAFWKAYSVSNIVLPASVTTIEKEAFREYITELTVPASVKVANNIFAKNTQGNLTYPSRLFCVKNSVIYNNYKGAGKISTVNGAYLNKTAVTAYTGVATQLTGWVQTVRNYTSSVEKPVQASGLTWKSSNTGVAKVDSKGKVTGVKPGTATITALWEDIPLTAKVTVKGPSISTTSKTIPVNTSATLSVSGGSGSVSWSSSNKAIARVDSKGKVTGVKVGTATIYATRNGNKTSCKVTVSKPAVSVKSKTMLTGAGYTLKVSGGSGTTTWKSSNSAVAKVSSSGRVTAMKAGTATITAKRNGYSSTSKITVQKNEAVFKVDTKEAVKQATSSKRLLMVASKLYFKGETLVAEYQIFNYTGKKATQLVKPRIVVKDKSYKTVVDYTFSNRSISLSNKKSMKYSFTIPASAVKQKGVKLNSQSSSGRWDFSWNIYGSYR